MIFVSIHTYYMSWNLYTHHQRKHVDDPRHQPSQQGSVINTPPPRRWASESLWALGCNLESTHVNSCQINEFCCTSTVEFYGGLIICNPLPRTFGCFGRCFQHGNLQERLHSRGGHIIADIAFNLRQVTLPESSQTDCNQLVAHLKTRLRLCWFNMLVSRFIFWDCVFLYSIIESACHVQVASMDFLSRRAEINVFLCWWTITST